MPSIGPVEILFVIAILVVTVGAKRIPDIARGMGSGIRNFKGSLRAGSRDDSRGGDEPDA